MKTLFIIPLFCICTLSYGQKKAISGQVIDKLTQTPLKGANIIILGSTNGAVTNDSGYFEFSKSYKNSLARISYIGYKPLNIELDPKSFLSIELEKETTLLPTINLGIGEYDGPNKYIEPEQYENDPDIEEEEFDQMFEIVEAPAWFYRGDENLYAFFAANFRYPKEVLEKNLYGSVLVEFTVLADGSVDKVKFKDKVIRQDIKQEIERVFSMMPTWAPATQRGQNVEQGFMITIKYAANKQ